MSLAVSVLQKNSEGCLFCLRPMSDASNASLSCCKKSIFDTLTTYEKESVLSYALLNY